MTQITIALSPTTLFRFHVFKLENFGWSMNKEKLSLMKGEDAFFPFSYRLLPLAPRFDMEPCRGLEIVLSSLLFTFDKLGDCLQMQLLLLSHVAFVYALAM